MLHEVGSHTASSGQLVFGHDTILLIKHKPDLEFLSQKN